MLSVLLGMPGQRDAGPAPSLLFARETGRRTVRPGAAALAALAPGAYRQLDREGLLEALRSVEAGGPNLRSSLATVARLCDLGGTGAPERPGAGTCRNTFIALGGATALLRLLTFGSGAPGRPAPTDEEAEASSVYNDALSLLRELCYLHQGFAETLACHPYAIPRCFELMARRHDFPWEQLLAPVARTEPRPEAPRPASFRRARPQPSSTRWRSRRKCWLSATPRSACPAFPISRPCSAGWTATSWDSSAASWRCSSFSTRCGPPLLQRRPQSSRHSQRAGRIELLLLRRSPLALSRNVNIINTNSF